MHFIFNNIKHYYVCFLLLVLPLFAHTKTFDVLLYNDGNPPYSMFNSGQKSGIFIDIFKRLSELTGHKFNFRQLPVARGLREFDMGNIDIEPGINISWRKSRAEVGLYTIAYASSTEVLFGKKIKKIGSATDIYHSMVGIVRGYKYAVLENHFSKDKIIKIENRSEKELLKQLVRNHIDYVCIGYITAKYYQLQNPQYRIFENVFELGNADVSMRLHPKNEKYLSEFNKALAFMIKNKEIDAIYQKYTFSKLK
ncbi:substrate-binding periplasmic protein [Pseudoalteromonas denitrificans]|uniref:Polar amino acid transport system substrate-binding protein n=1 Tax=Pseudoalteromonas denitrificans DSM 6059 TaxID=1123010 RepID=A0A1I1M5R2_9GAMM|nr:transporter substrate-binding domain-containing protein [Pseudoalteromonas denitrificans]SFC80082.1 polar amino acid transport system substrate-binding protein [Pseudoalteromonas denitrificans DSM 6059]